jgi:hypothetical protein
MDNFTKIPITFLLLLFLLLSFKQFQTYNGTYRILYLIIIVLACIATKYETDSTGCGFFDCKDETSRSKLDKTHLACNEMNRVCWRRAIILSTIVLLVSGIVNENNKINLVIWFVLFFLLYFYFNFDQYHRFRVLCEN